MARDVTRGAAPRKGKPAPQKGAPGKAAPGKAAPGKAAPGKGDPAPRKGAAGKGAPAEPGAKAPRPPAPTDGYIAVAEVARPHGVQGELRLKIYNPDSDLLEQKPRVRLRLPGGATRDLAIVSARAADKALLVRLAGVDDRDAAELLRGAEVCVPRESFPPLEEGEFYACDLEGARAVLRSGELVGHVSGVASYPTCDVLLVERAAGSRLEIPILEPYVGAIDAKNGVVEIITIDGLD